MAFALDQIGAVATVVIVGRPSAWLNRTVYGLLESRGLADSSIVFGPPGTDGLADYLPTAAASSPIRADGLTVLLNGRHDQIGHNQPVAAVSIVLNNLSHLASAIPPVNRRLRQAGDDGDNEDDDDDDDENERIVGAYSMPSVRRLLFNARNYRISPVVLESKLADVPVYVRGVADWIVWFPPADDDELTEELDLAVYEFFPDVDNLLDVVINCRNGGGAVVVRPGRPAYYQYFPAIDPRYIVPADDDDDDDDLPPLMNDDALGLPAMRLPSSDEN